MKAKERNEIAEMVETAKELAEKDPQGFMLAKNSLDILKARAAMDKEPEKEVQKRKGEDDIYSAGKEKILKEGCESGTI